MIVLLNKSFYYLNPATGLLLKLQWENTVHITLGHFHSLGVIIALKLSQALLAGEQKQVPYS